MEGKLSLPLALLQPLCQVCPTARCPGMLTIARLILFAQITVLSKKESLNDMQSFDLSNHGGHLYM
jgi:hypothetical protein